MGLAFSWASSRLEILDRRKVQTKDTQAMKGMRHCGGTWLGLGLGLRLRLGLDPPLRGHLVRVRVRVK